MPSSENTGSNVRGRSHGDLDPAQQPKKRDKRDRANAKDGHIAMDNGGDAPRIDKSKMRIMGLGWLEVPASSSMTRYFWNENTNQTSWIIPDELASQTSEVELLAATPGPLPPG